jgi:quercetin dioxygenase-like cupin family protein
MSDYFSEGPAGTETMRVVPAGRLPEVTLTAGIRAAVLLGERVNINVVTLEANAEAKAHTHDEEQMGYVVSGSCDFFDGSRSMRMQPGDAYHAPPGAPHGARAHERGCVIIDVFSPPRAGLREMIADAEDA